MERKKMIERILLAALLLILLRAIVGIVWGGA